MMVNPKLKLSLSVLSSATWVDVLSGVAGFNGLRSLNLSDRLDQRVAKCTFMLVHVMRRVR